MRAHSGVHSPQRIQESKQAGEPRAAGGALWADEGGESLSGGLAVMRQQRALTFVRCGGLPFAASWPKTCTEPVLDPGYGEI